MAENLQICTRCVMDTSDPDITFNDEGVCSHCRGFDDYTSKRWFPNNEGQQRLEKLVTQMKQAGRGRPYDCILGLSGGLDSSFLALVLQDYGLRPLLVHVDAGWNSEFAVQNIQTVVDSCGFELHTIRVDREEMMDLQLAYLKAGVANQDVPQDHAFFSNLYGYAVKNKVRHVISGSNIATECIIPNSRQHSAMDAINLRAIHRAYGTIPLKQFNVVSFYRYYIYYPFIKKMEVVKPLNLMPYSKADALKRLQEVGYVAYERKHGESRFTKLFQNYYLPKKFGVDKRKPHLSSLIVTGQLTREDALGILDEPLYDPDELVEDKQFVADQLGISISTMDDYINAPNGDYSEFANWDSRYKLLKQSQGWVQKLMGKRIAPYA